MPARRTALERAQQHYRDHGTLACFDAHDPRGAKSLRRLALHRRRLTVDQLLELGAQGFELDRREARWPAGYRHLLAFLDEHEPIALSARRVASDGYPLGNWLFRQRQATTTGRLSPERLALLIEAGIDLPSTPEAEKLRQLTRDFVREQESQR